MKRFFIVSVSAILINVAVYAAEVPKHSSRLVYSTERVVPRKEAFRRINAYSVVFVAMGRLRSVVSKNVQALSLASSILLLDCTLDVK